MATPTSICIAGTGLHVPERILTNVDLERFVDTSDEWITSRTGIKQRHISSAQEPCSLLGAEAAKRALADAGMSPEQVTHVLMATFTPDTFIPSASYSLRSRLGIPRGMAMDISAACTGFLFGLETARALVTVHPEAVVLVVGSEVVTSRINWEDRGTCVLFGDGAGAAVIASGPAPGGATIVDVILDGDSSLGELLTVRGGGSAAPLCPGDRIGDDFFVQMQGREIFKHAVRSMNTVVRKLLDRQNLSVADIDMIIPHQANIRIIESLIKKLEFSEEKVYINIASYGNTSAASIPIALAEAREKSLIPEGSKVILTSFGGGLNWGAALLQF
ncbi:MAG TPA: ketoacyl-ACP synthase III [Desulfonatronum sp.]|nr:ketoacyl-ACP synthase III [Desulfonatronum sp.]